MNNQNEIFFAYAHLNPRDQWFIKSLLAIYQPRAKKTWEYASDIAQCDVVFVGEEDQEGLVNSMQELKLFQYVILLSEELEIPHARLFKVNPRQFSGKILEAIEKCETALMGLIPQAASTSRGALMSASAPLSTEEANSQALKLLMWPSVAFIRSDPNYAVLATLIMNKKMSLNALIQKSGFSSACCQRFMSEAKNLGFIEISSVTGEHTDSGQGDQKRSEKLGLFARIRNRLGLRGSKSA